MVQAENIPTNCRGAERYENIIHYMAFMQEKKGCKSSTSAEKTTEVHQKTTGRVVRGSQETMDDKLGAAKGKAWR